MNPTHNVTIEFTCVDISKRCHKRIQYLLRRNKMWNYQTKRYCLYDGKNGPFLQRSIFMHWNCGNGVPMGCRWDIIDNTICPCTVLAPHDIGVPWPLIDRDVVLSMSTMVHSTALLAQVVLTKSSLFR